MFPLGVITDEISQDFEYALDRMVEWDIPHAEIRGAWNKNVSDFSPEDMAKVKAALKARGLDVCGIASPFYKCDLSGALAADTGALHLAQNRALTEQLDVLERCIRAAHELETPNIRVFAFWRRGETTPEMLEQMTELFHEPLRRAREAGVTLLLENEHDCAISAGVDTANFIAPLAAEGLRALWDPGNAAFAEMEPPFPDGYEALKPYIAHVHVKDSLVGADGKRRFVPVGQGDLDYVGHFKALNRDGYSGVISIETHYRPEGGTPEQGTYETLQGLRGVLKQAEA